MRKTTLKQVFLTGLLVLVPIIITLWMVGAVIRVMDVTLALLPERWQPYHFFGFDIPGIGAVLTILIIFIVGLIAHNFLGLKLVHAWDALLRHIPVIGPIYKSVKQVSDTLLSGKSNAFRKALLIQYPRQGIYTIAFLTGKPDNEVAEHFAEEYLSVYMPTTPNPTSGFFLMLRKEEVIELNMSVDNALKYIVSMGVVAPSAVNQKPVKDKNTLKID